MHIQGQINQTARQDKTPIFAAVSMNSSLKTSSAYRHTPIALPVLLSSYSGLTVGHTSPNEPLQKTSSVLRLVSNGYTYLRIMAVPYGVQRQNFSKPSNLYSNLQVTL